MVDPSTAVAAVSQGIEASGRFPDYATFLTRTGDQQGVDANVTPPVIVTNEISTTRNERNSTDLVGYATDDAGARIGRIWEVTYRMRLEVDIFTAAGDSRHDIADLGADLKQALYRYDAQTRGDLLPDPTTPVESDETEAEITELTVSDGEPADDLTASPSIRRRRQTVHTRFVDRLNEADEYGPRATVEEVITAGDGDYVALLDDDDTIDLEYHPER